MAMIFLSILILIVAIALPSISQNIRSILYVRISSIIFIYAGALAFNAFYIQSIGSGIGIYSGLFQVTTINLIFDVLIYINNNIYFIINDSVSHETLMLVYTNLIKTRINNKKSFHSSKVLNANVPPLSNNPEQDAIDFKEMLDHSEPMTASEYIEATITPFAEAFPQLSNKPLGKKKEIIEQSLNSLVENVNKDNADLFTPLLPLFTNKNNINRIVDMTNPNLLSNDLRFKNTVDKILSENNIISQTGGKVIAYSNGKMIIDVNSIEEYIEKLIRIYKENPDLITYGVPGGLLLYKAVVYLHAKTAFVDPNTLKDESLRLAYLQMRAKQVFIFNTTAASYHKIKIYFYIREIVKGLMGIGYAIKNNRSKSINTMISGINDKDKSISIFTLLSNKINNNSYGKYIFLLIFIIIVVLLPYSSIPTLSFLNLQMFTMLKIIGVLFTNLLLIYNLLTLYYMNKYTRVDTIHFKKYTPAFVKSYFMELHSMSKLKDVYIIKEMVIKNTILCFLLQTVVLILLLVLYKPITP
uniref:LAGLIDADG endonuclease n=1 Tax=Ganoderma calidophilum TaxID=2026244 RepID=A0A2S1WBN7_9APHY|nr:hypothetical protein [Ganoderma calidophilum]AWJ64003.1 hypothetical protein [Ganoderma calidophilum]